MDDDIRLEPDSVLRANAFATTVLRLQRERQHAVVDTGLYGIVRHPFYAGTPLVLVGLTFWLESYTAMLFAVVPIALMVLRLNLEAATAADVAAHVAEVQAVMRG